MAHIQPLGPIEAASKKALGDTAPAPQIALGETEAASKNALAAAEVDRRLREALRELQLAERNSVLWFAEVLKRKLFRDLGFSSIYQYASEALGFSRPRTAQFIRLCESLEGLPELKDSVAAGDVSWTKAREVAKVATPQTETAWVDLARVESRRKLERRVRMAQTHSRAKRRHGGRQLGLADAGATPAGSPGATPAGNPTAIPADSLGAVSTDISGVQATRVAGEAMPSDIAFAEIPVTLSLRFTPEQYARYEAILEQLRKHGERGAREELILAGMEALLGEAGSSAADPVSGREAKSSARGAAAVPAREAKSSAAPKTTLASPRGRASDPSADSGKVSPRNHKPTYQIVVQQCEDCGRARVQTSRGVMPIAPATAEAMSCDARVLRTGERNRAGSESRPGERNRADAENRSGDKSQPCDETRSDDNDHPDDENHPGEKNRIGGRNRVGGECRSDRRSRVGGECRSDRRSRDGGECRSDRKNRATIPPSVRREVMARDGYRCRAPGCGSARFLEVHHVVSRAAGGSNRPDNLVTLCSACHRITHAHPHRENPPPRAPTG